MSATATTVQVATSVAWLIFGTATNNDQVQSAHAIQYESLPACITALAKLQYVERSPDSRMTIKPFCSALVPNWWRAP